MDSTIGFIGLGRIGMRLASNLLAAGLRVVGCDIVPKPEFVERGGTLVKTAAAVAGSAQVILHSLPEVAALHAVMDGPGGLLSCCGAAHVIADLSAYPLAEKRRAAEKLAARGTVMLDCQITGTPEMLSERRGVIFVSGDRAAAERCDPIFAAAVERHRFIGGFGMATRLKTANNLLVAINTAAAAEALALAIGAGVDAEIAIEVIGNGAGQSQMFRQRAPMMAARSYPATSASLGSFAVYLDLIEAAQRDSGLDVPLTRTVLTLYRHAIAVGWGDQDMACIYELIRNSAS